MWNSVRTQLVAAVKSVKIMPFFLLYIYIYIFFFFSELKENKKNLLKKQNKTKNAMEIKTDFKHLSGCLG